MLKLSGEALMGDDPYAINRATMERIVAEVTEVVRMGVEVGVVIGGGNIFRGVAPGAAGMDRATADYMGMLGTVINSMALQDALEKQGVQTRVMSAIAMAEGKVKPIQAASNPGRPACIWPNAIATWLEAGPGRNWQKPTMAA